MRSSHLLGLASLLLLACNATSAPRGVSLPRGALPIEAGESSAGARSCRCLLVHVTTSSYATRDVDRATVAAATNDAKTRCAYELLADRAGDAPTPELRPILEQAMGAPVDLAIRVDDPEPRVVAIADVESLRRACGE